MDIKPRIYLIFRIIIPILLFLAGLRYYSLNYPRSIVSIDEGLIASSVRRILLGQVVYKDFHICYGPGIYYLYSWIIKLFNINIFLLGRLWQMLLVSIFSVVIYYISLRVLPRPLAFFAGLYTLFVCRIGINLGWASAHSFGVLFAFISLLFILKFYELDKKIYLILSGIFFGLTSLFFHPWALFMGVSIFAHLIIQKYIFYKNNSLALQYPLRRVFVNISIILSSFLAVVLIPAVYFCSQFSLKGLIRETFILPIAAAKGQKFAFYPKLIYTNYLNFFHINSLYFPAFVILFSVSFFLYRFWARKLDKKDNCALLLIILSALTYYYFHLTPAESHWFVILPSVNILGLYLIYRAAAYIFKNPKVIIPGYIKKFILLLFILPLVIYYFKPPYTSLWDGGTLRIYWGAKYLCRNFNNHNTLFRYLIKERSRESWYYCPDNYGEYTVAEYLKRETAPVDKIYVFASSPLLYYLADRSSPTKNDHFLMCGLNIEGENEEIFYLERDPPKYIILVPNMFTQQSWDYHRILANYILTNYYQIDDIDNYLIFVKKPKLQFYR